MTDLNELVVFMAVVQHGSISAAARALGMPISTVSRKLGDLEARLGVNLIKRTTRKLSLNDAGERFFEGCAQHIKALEAAEASLTHTRTELEGQLRVTAPIALGRGEFIDFVAGFLRKYPRLRFDLELSNQFVDLVTSRVDVAIRFGDLADAGVIAKRLGVSRRLLAASPSYLERCGTPKTPEDLTQHQCVLFRSKTEGTAWTLQAGRRRAKISVSGRVSASNLEAVNEFATRGYGIALVSEFHLIAGVSSGTLKRVLSAWTSPPIPVHAVYLSRKFTPANVQAFLSELAAWRNSTWTEKVS